MVSSSSSPPSSSLLPEEPTAFLGRGYSRRYTPIFFSFSFSSIFHSLPLSDHGNRSPPDQSVSGNQLRQFDWNGCQFHPQIIGLKPSSPFGPILWYAPCRQKVKLLRQKWFDPSATIKPSASVERAANQVFLFRSSDPCRRRRFRFFEKGSQGVIVGSDAVAGFHRTYNKKWNWKMRTRWKIATVMIDPIRLDRTSSDCKNLRAGATIGCSPDEIFSGQMI